jgi:hypothetical protein
MINWKGIGRRKKWPNLRENPGIRLKGLTTKTSVRIAGVWAEI